jgi:preprotein translocase subunit Sec61beta
LIAAPATVHQWRSRRISHRPWQATILLLIGCGALVATVLAGHAWAGELEAKVKAAYIYNFTKFIDWPGEEKVSAGEPIKICIIGSDPIRTTLGELANREAKGRPLKIMRVKDASSISPCHLLFISRSEEPQLPLILQRLQGTRVLTVSDMPQFAQRGGMISFITEKERVKIEINPRVVRQSGLKVSAKLLEIARVVQ